MREDTLVYDNTSDTITGICDRCKQVKVLEHYEDIHEWLCDNCRGEK